ADDAAQGEELVEGEVKAPVEREALVVVRRRGAVERARALAPAEPSEALLQRRLHPREERAPERGRRHLRARLEEVAGGREQAVVALVEDDAGLDAGGVTRLRVPEPRQVVDLRRLDEDALRLAGQEHLQVLEVGDVGT